MSYIKLSGVTGSFVAQKAKYDDHMIVLCRILSVGNYTDMNGTVVPVTEKMLKSLVENYNTRLEQEFDKYKQSILEQQDTLDPSIVNHALSMTIDEFDLLPNQLDHNMASIKDTVGNVMGKIFLKESLGKLAIFANIKVKGEDNVRNVVNGTWRNLSLGFDMENNRMHEISWVIYGADSNANKILGINNYIAPTKPNNICLQELFAECEEVINKLNQRIYLKTRTIELCKLRKITKADRFIIETKLSNVMDLRSLNNLFDILEEYIPNQGPKSNVVLLSKEEAKMLQNTLFAASNKKIYENI